MQHCFMLVCLTLLCLTICQSQIPINATLIQYCLVKENSLSTEFTRLKPMIQYSDMTPGDILITQNTYSNNQFLGINFGTMPPCIVGFLNEMPNSVLVCEIKAQNSYFYFYCNDVVAVSQIQMSADYNAPDSITALGYFWYGPSIPSGLNPPFETQNFNYIRSGGCEAGGNGFMINSFQMANELYGLPSVSCTPMGNWYMNIVGLNQLPLFSSGIISLVSTSSNSAPSQSYTIDNTGSQVAFTFSLSNILTSTYTSTYSIQYSQSSTITQMVGFTLTEAEEGSFTEDGIGAKSTTTMSFTTQFTASASTSELQTTSNAVTYTNTIQIGGTVSVPAGCLMTITEKFSLTTNAYQQAFTINSQSSGLMLNEYILAPTGYTITST